MVQVYTYRDYLRYSPDALLNADGATSKNFKGKKDGKVTFGEFKTFGIFDYLKDLGDDGEAENSLYNRALAALKKYAGDTGDNEEISADEYKKFLESSEFKNIKKDYQKLAAQDMEDGNGEKFVDNKAKAKADKNYMTMCDNIIKGASSNSKVTLDDLKKQLNKNYPEEIKTKLDEAIDKFFGKEGEKNSKKIDKNTLAEFLNSKEYQEVMDEVTKKNGKKGGSSGSGTTTPQAKWSFGNLNSWMQELMNGFGMFNQYFYSMGLQALGQYTTNFFNPYLSIFGNQNIWLA